MFFLERRPFPTTALWFLFAGLFLRASLSAVPIPENWAPLINIVASVLLYGLPAVLYYHVRPWQQVESLRLNRLPNLRTCLFTVLAAIAGALFLYVLLALWEALLSSVGVHLEWLGVPALPQSMLVGLIAMAMVPAVCEELMFRGLLLPALERLGAGVAIFLSGVVFALMHGNLAGFPAHLLLGILLGLLAWGTDSLWVPMLFHFVYNGFLVWTSYRMAPVAQDATYYLVTRTDIAVLGVMALVLLAVWTFFLYALLRHAGVETQPAPRKAARWPFWVMLGTLLTLQAANYGAQFILLSAL